MVHVDVVTTGTSCVIVVYTCVSLYVCLRCRFVALLPITAFVDAFDCR